MKIAGITREVFVEALEQARKGRLHILGKMLDAIAEPRAELSEYAPRIINTKVHPDKIREIIGSGGKTIKKIVITKDTIEGKKQPIIIKSEEKSA